MKIVMIIDRDLPNGMLANTAAVLGISVGAMVADVVGPGNLDADGRAHRGITQRTIPVLAGTAESIRELRDRLYESEYAAITVIDFSGVARNSLNYATYTTELAKTPSSELSYLGICLCGPDKLVNKLTGSMRLLR
ncbi:MAG: DUF2000 domain-containing protein [bacterium]|jgi:hypothetical protein